MKYLTFQTGHSIRCDISALYLAQQSQNDGGGACHCVRKISSVESYRKDCDQGLSEGARAVRRRREILLKNLHAGKDPSAN